MIYLYGTLEIPQADKGASMITVPIIECVPNFSEGRDRRVIDAIAAAITAIDGVRLLDVDPGVDTHRTVYTFVGSPEPVLSAALAAARVAREMIDMRKHHGEHPRMGALDVCPFIPVSGATMDDCIEVSRKFGAMLAAECSVPVYLYEKAATKPERQSLADIRSGEYEGLKVKLEDPAWAPDFGPANFEPAWGATVTGAREFLIAYNVNLNTRDRKLANEVAMTVREGGRAVRDSSGSILKDAEGRTLKQPGLLPGVRAIGWYIDSYRCAQVSINLTDHHKTALHKVFDTVKAEAEKLGLLVTGSELVGLVPLDAILDAGRHYRSRAGKSPGAPERELVETAIRSLGLDSVSPFEPSKKIIEYASAAPAPLLSMKVVEFLDEVSMDTPAPGGGSVSALAGSLGAALAGMVASLGVEKKGLESAKPRLSDLSVRAQSVKDQLARAVDEDTKAFNAIISANKMPKSTQAQILERDFAQNKAYEYATRIPLMTARLCMDAICICGEAARLGNPASVSDAGVGALLAQAGLEGALLNVRTNLVSLKSEEQKESLILECEKLESESRVDRDEILSVVRRIIGV